MRTKFILGALLAIAIGAAPAAAQQSIGPDAIIIPSGPTIDKTAANVAGGCIALTGSWPKQTIIGAAGVDARTTTSEAIADSDRCKLVTFTNASAVAATIAQAGSGGNFNSTWVARLLNLGVGSVTLTPATSTINGASTLVLTTGQGADIYSDGTNYLAQVGKGSGGSGTVTSVATGACLTGGTITTTGTIAGINAVDPRTTTSEAVANSDQCKLVSFNNASAVAATIAQAGAGGNFAAGWRASLLNLGAGTVTLTPATSTINGSATLAIATAKGCDIYSDGSNYFAQCGSSTGAGAGTVTSVACGSGLTCSPSPIVGSGTVSAQTTVPFLEQHTASASATLDFTTGITGACHEYELDVDGLVPASNNVNLLLTFQTGGSTWQASAYSWGQNNMLHTAGPVAAGNGSASASFIQIFPGSSNSASNSTNLRLRLFNALNGSLYKGVSGDDVSFFNGGAAYQGNFSGTWQGTTVLTGLRLAFSSGNIASGVGTLICIVQ